MTTEEIANRLVELCREGKWEQVYRELFSEKIESIEPEGGPWGTVKGLDALAKKAQEWEGMVEEFHSMEISNPIVADNFISLSMKSKVTMKGAPGPVNMDEICLYRVSEGRVVSEQFFYTPVPQTV